MPGNPDTKYYAGTGLTLNGTTFSISQEYLDKINNSGGLQLGGEQTLYCNGSKVVAWYERGEIVNGNSLFRNVSATSGLSDSVGGTWVISSTPSYFTEYRYKETTSNSSGESSTGTVIGYAWSLRTKQILG